ncbi:class I SAM-dependent methyltransferase [Pseudomonas sp. OIL-1]|nr:class I SAM-dependent methyltransferase [Pseudomonas sp. OIL-1]
MTLQLSPATPVDHAPPAETPDTTQGMLALGRYLQSVDYQFVAVTPDTHQHYLRRMADRPVRDLRDVFGWSRPFRQDQVSTDEFELMQQAGVLGHKGEVWRSRIRWSSLGNWLCAHSAYPTDSADAVFFGPDTYRFARLIQSYLADNAGSVRRAVDIGCGSGAGAMLVAGACPDADVLAVDINPQALRMAAINTELAGLSNIRTAQSNLLNDVEGDFDLIVANPPYMMDSQERAYRHGGGTLGAGLSERIVSAALERLAPGGSLVLYTGVAIVAGRDVFREGLHQRLTTQPCSWRYQEIDPDVFGEELLKPAYAEVERIAAVGLVLTRDR